MGKGKVFEYSKGKIEVTPGRAAVVTFPDASQLIVFDEGGNNLIVAPLGIDNENEEAVRAWRFFYDDCQEQRAKRLPRFEMEPAIYEALRAATMMSNKRCNERLGGV